VRRGRVVDRVELVTEAGTAPMGTESDVLTAALSQFYETTPAPVEIVMPVEVDDAEALEAWLGERAGRRERSGVPKRGEKKGLLELASRNAAIAYDTRYNADTLANYQALETLAAVLRLPAIPRRIDCFDISTIQGSDTVASMVVCEDGRMKKGEYRKFRIRGLPRIAPVLDVAETEDPQSPPMAIGADPRAVVNPPAPAAAPSGEPSSRAGAAESPSKAMGADPRAVVHPPAPAAAASGESSSRAAAADGGGAPSALRNDDFAAMQEVVLRRYRK